MIKQNDDFRKRKAVEKWVEMGKPVLTLEIVKQLRQETTLGLMDIKHAIRDSKEFKDMIENQPEIDIRQRPIEKYIRIYKPDGTLLIETNQFTTYLWVRTQIKKKKLYGYYIEFEGVKIAINANGTEVFYPEGMMDLSTKLLFELI